MFLTRRARSLARYFLVASALCVYSYINNATTPYINYAKSSTGEDYRPRDEHFTLCNRKLYLKNMMRSPPMQRGKKYGVQDWDRDPKKGIVLVPRTEGHRTINGQKVEIVYGRTGNQIQEFFRAFDMARDRGGALVIHGEGFPLDFTLRKLYLGLDNRTEFEERFGVAFYDALEEGHRSNLTDVYMDDAYHYISDHPNFNIVDIIEHRQYVIQELYRMTAGEMELHPNSPGVAAMCLSLYTFFGKDGEGGDEQNLRAIGVTKKITRRYTVIHSRKGEALGKAFLKKAHEVFGVDDRAGIDLPVDLVASILAPLGMTNSSVLMITDGQNTGPIQRLSSDPLIGPLFQVVPEKVSTLTGDIMLAILGDVFIGSPVSTFSIYIAQARYALGIGESYLFARRDATTNKWETFCNDEACLYHWTNIFVPLF